MVKTDGKSHRFFFGLFLNLIKTGTK